jgi:hypothetical protein
VCLMRSHKFLSMLYLGVAERETEMEMDAIDFMHATHGMDQVKGGSP